MRYPLFLDLRDQPVVVIGAGKIAARKIRSLLAAGARVIVISPKAHRLPKNVRWLPRRYRRGDLAGARLVIAATDDLHVNGLVCAEAKRRRQLVNCVAPPLAGNFFVPAVARRGGIAIAISTDGRSPTLAKRLRQELEQFLRARYPRAEK